MLTKYVLATSLAMDMMNGCVSIYRACTTLQKLVWKEKQKHNTGCLKKTAHRSVPSSILKSGCKFNYILHCLDTGDYYTKLDPNFNSIPYTVLLKQLVKIAHIATNFYFYSPSVFS